MIALEQSRPIESLPAWPQPCTFAQHYLALRILQAHTGVILAIRKGFPPRQTPWGDNLHQEDTRPSAEPHSHLLMKRRLGKGNHLCGQILQYRARMQRNVES